MTYGKPFSRLNFYENIDFYIEKGWGSYNDLINMTVKDFVEIRIGLESKAKKKKLEESLGGIA